MTDEQLQGNRIIAEFLNLSEGFPHETDQFGYHQCVEGYNVPNIINHYKHKDDMDYHQFKIDQLQYHSSFDWLMPVVEKIQSIPITPAPNYRGYRIEIVVQGYVEITGFPMPRISTNVSIEGSLINAIYSAVIQFITWYNKTKKT